MTTQEVFASIDTAFDLFQGLGVKPVLFGFLTVLCPKVWYEWLFITRYVFIKNTVEK